VRVTDEQCLGGATLDVTTIGDPGVRVLRQYTIPGRDQRVAIVSFRGIATEYGYESQVPVLLPRYGEPARKVEALKDDDARGRGR
jgi:hypothetical protein